MILRKGDKGTEVSRLQGALVQAGFPLEIDGIYGPKTAAAVARFQRQSGLVEDGIYGPKTELALYRPKEDRGELLTHADIERAALRLGVPVASVMAVNSVESRGRGFNADGSLIILFERHVMRRRLQAHGYPQADIDALASRYPDIINPSAGGYLGGGREWERLNRARAVHDSAALESASYGLFQIMGHHWKRLGYDSVQSFVASMEEGESRQLEAFVRFIETDQVLHKALKNSQWALFAKYYNGPAYEKNQYDIKMAQAFDRFSELHPEAGQALA